MTTLHRDLAGVQLHDMYHYVQSADPGAVGAGKNWLDTTSSPFIIKRRNAGDAGWDLVGAPGVPISGQFDASLLTFDTVADGEYLKRVGTGIVSGVPPGIVPASGQFNADLLTFDATVDGEFLKRVGTGIVSAAAPVPSQGQFNADTLDFNTLVDGEYLKRVGSTIVTGSSAAGPASQIIETAGPTTLDIGAVADGEYLKRVGTDIVGGTPSGGGGSGQYSPDLPPASPSSDNDEFDDDTITGWTAANSGGATRNTDEAVRHGFLLMEQTDGGGGSGTAYYKAFTPGANNFAIAVKVFGDVSKAGSNQVGIGILDGSGAFMWGCQMLNGNTFIVSTSTGWNTYDVRDISRDTGKCYILLRGDGAGSFDALVSSDGMVWRRLEGVSGRSGTIGRAQLSISSFSSSVVMGYYEFFRVFASQTTEIGGVP